MNVSRRRAAGSVSDLQQLLERRHAIPLRVDLRLRGLRRLEQLTNPRSARAAGASAREQPLRLVALRVERHPEAQPELGVVLEERVRPGWPAALFVHRPRGRRQVAAVDGGAAGRVGDEQAVAEELRQEPQVRRLAAARAGAGELEERRQVLRAAHERRVKPHGLVVGKRVEELQVRFVRARESGPSPPC